MSVKGQEKGNEWGERGVRAQRGETREKSPPAREELGR